MGPKAPLPLAQADQSQSDYLSKLNKINCYTHGIYTE